MRKLGLLIAALHAGAALTAGAGAPVPAVRAQEAAEVRAYMGALARGTPQAMAAFRAEFPRSTLPGSELGASIAASLRRPPPAPPAAGPEVGARDYAAAGFGSVDQGIY